MVRSSDRFPSKRQDLAEVRWWASGSPRMTRAWDADTPAPKAGTLLDVLILSECGMNLPSGHPVLTDA